MYQTVQEFLEMFQAERGGTQKMLNALTDASLTTGVGGEHRNIGRIAWHIVTTYPEMGGQGGIVINSVKSDAPVPRTAAEIAKAYESVTDELASFIKTHWKDSDLQTSKNFYGFDWTLARMLGILVVHEVHHRGQLTVLMRQAGLKVPGVYGPALEEWSNYGGTPPVV